jgi:hypothetical protein
MKEEEIVKIHEELSQALTPLVKYYEDARRIPTTIKGATTGILNIVYSIPQREISLALGAGGNKSTAATWYKIHNAEAGKNPVYREAFEEISNRHLADVISERSEKHAIDKKPYMDMKRLTEEFMGVNMSSKPNRKDPKSLEAMSMMVTAAEEILGIPGSQRNFCEYLEIGRFRLLYAREVFQNRYNYDPSYTRRYRKYLEFMSGKIQREGESKLYLIKESDLKKSGINIELIKQIAKQI